MNGITFMVHGVPVPQGSKMPYGGEANPHVKAWRASIAEAAADKTVLEGPVSVHVFFCFPRPKKHYRGGKHSLELRADAPRHHATTPDLDKLQRAVGDALKGVLLRDDSQIAAWTTVKVYGEKPFARITVTPL